MVIVHTRNIFMKINIILFLMSVFLVFIIRASQELEQMITKTDIEGVKKLLSTIELDSETKTRLINLANDIVLMRLKNIERYSFDDVTGSYDFNVLKESLSQQTIDGLNKESTQWRKWKLIRNISLVGAGIGLYYFVIGLGFFPKIESDGGMFLLIFGSLIASIETLYSAHKMAVVDSALLRRIRSNLQKIYRDSIIIKQLIINAPGLACS